MRPTRSVLIASAGALLILGSIFGSIPACTSGPSGPNVLLISIDMLRPDHLACYGYARNTSPNIDRLAREGVLFENEISSSSWTLPAHAALFTSLPDSLHGCTDTDKALGPGAVTLAERFALAGYETAGFFSGPYLHPAFGLGQGFQRYENCTSYAAELDQHPAAQWGMDVKVMKESHADVTNERVLSHVQKWMSERSKKPFFAFVHLWDVHFDFIPPPPFDKQFDPDYKGWVTGQDFFFDKRIHKDMDKRDLAHLIALYDGEIAWTDSIIGKIRAELEQAGLLDNTIIALTSDHGTEFFEHGSKGHRQTLYDEVIKVPLIVRYPARLPASKRIGDQTRSIDVGPTLMELAGLFAPVDVMGQSLMPTIEHPENTHNQRAVSELMSVGHNLRSVRTKKWKFVDVIGADDPGYFDLTADPGEKTRSTDRETDLGKRSTEGYLAEVEALEAFLQRHPPSVIHSEIPDAVKKHLRESGYVGEDDQSIEKNMKDKPIGDFPDDKDTPRDEK